MPDPVRKSTTADNKAARIQTQKDHAVARLQKRLDHEANAKRHEDNAQALERRGDRRGAAMLWAKAQAERTLAEGFK